jgi:outer membrane protein TolC
MSADEARKSAVANRPLLKAIDQTVQQWAAAGDAARRQLWPNFSLSLGYRQRAFMQGDPVGGSDFLSFGVGINLPVFRGRKQRRKIAEARANARATEARYEAAEQKILFGVQTLYLEIQQHRDEAELFQTAILPQARQSLESAMAGYQVDKVDFLTLLNSQVSLLNFEIDYYRHVTDHEKLLAELEAVVGKRLF